MYDMDRTARDTPDQEVGALAHAARGVLDADLDGVSDEALGADIAALYTVAQQLEGERLRRLRAFEARKAFTACGARSAKGWLADTCGLTIGEAAGDVDTARQLARLPQTAKALSSGQLSLRKAKVITRAAKELTGKGDSALDALAAAAGDDDLRTLRDKVDRVVAATDDEALARGEHDAYTRRRVNKHRLPDGSSAGSWRLDPIAAEALDTALDALSRPQGKDDDRSAEQRQADALAELAWRALNGGELPTVGGQRPHIGVHIPAPGPTPTPAPTPDAGDDVDEAAPAQPATLDFGGAISAGAAGLLACDASVYRIVMSATSEVLDLGRKTRTATAAQRKAVIARDRRCVGCGAPPGWCDVHHVTPWESGGPTDMDNLALVCRRCHRKIHCEAWTMARTPDGWQLHAPARHPAAKHKRARPTTPAATGHACEARPAYTAAA